jgi:hypothetical protein
MTLGVKDVCEPLRDHVPFGSAWLCSALVSSCSSAFCLLAPITSTVGSTTAGHVDDWCSWELARLSQVLPRG